jgi:hypothetical protein
MSIVAMPNVLHGDGSGVVIELIFDSEEKPIIIIVGVGVAVARTPAFLSNSPEYHVKY